MATRIDASGDNLSRSATLPSQTTLSVLMRVRMVTDRGDYSLFFSIDAGASQYIQFGVNASRVMELYTYDGVASGADITSGLTMSTGTWYDIGFTKSGTSGVVYYGTSGASGLLSTNSGTVKNAPAGTALYLGNESGATQWWNGRLYGVKIWSGVALTADQMNSERRQIAPVNFASLWSYYPLFVHTAVQDQSGNGRDLTAGGTLTTEESGPVPWRVGRRRLILPAAAAPAGRTTKNTRSHPLGVNVGVNWRVAG